MKTISISIIFVLMGAKSSTFIFPDYTPHYQIPSTQPTTKPYTELDIFSILPPSTALEKQIEINTMKLDILNLQLKMEILKELLELHDKLFHKIPEFKKEDRQRV